jgi:transcription elongation factor Elf1
MPLWNSGINTIKVRLSVDKNTCPHCNGENFEEKYDYDTEEVFVECSDCGWTIGQWDDDFTEYLQG